MRIFPSMIGGGKNTILPFPFHRRRKTTEGTISISGYIRGVGRKYKGNGEGRGGGLWRFTTQTATRINIQAGASTD